MAYMIGNLEICKYLTNIAGANQNVHFSKQFIDENPDIFHLALAII
jgi:hypothetical protein